MQRNKNCDDCHEKKIKIIHKGVYKETKVCLTCNIVKPFRSHHCSDCDNCIIRFDHHCPWIGGCVGKRNYIYFFVFICLLNIRLIFVAVFCLIHIVYIFKDVPNEEKNNKNWIAQNLIGLIPSILTIIFIGCTMAFTMGLMIYHIKLIINNITTKEEIKKLIFENIGNPYDKGINNNCKEFWTRHRTMDNEYTVKYLRNKIRNNLENYNNIINNKIEKKEFSKNKIIFSSLSKKELNLKNKNKNVIINNIRNEKEISDQSDNVSIHTEKNEEIKTNKKSINEKESCKNKNKKKFKEKNKIKKRNNNSNHKNKIKNKTSYKFPKKIEIEFSDEEISDENDNTNSRICNTSYKNKSNLNNNNLTNKFKKIELKIMKKNILSEKKINLNKNEKSYQIAQKRLEEISSEITINQELKCSISIPNENSFVSDLSQS